MPELSLPRLWQLLRFSGIAMKQDFIAPDWLNKAYLTKVLEERDADRPADIKLISFAVTSATNKGDNFASEMFRISVTYRCNGRIVADERMILKKELEQEDVKRLFDPYDIYRNEIECYRTYLPQFQKLLQAIGEDIKLVPTLIHCDPDHHTIIMEDVAVLGYRNASKANRFNMATARLLMHKLAAYHAASVIYNRENGGILERIETKLFDVRLKDGLMVWFTKLIDTLADTVQEWGDDYRAYGPKLKCIHRNFIRLGAQTLAPSPGHGVFSHGDCWFNNLMVRYEDAVDEDRPVDLLLVDLQLAGWSSQAIDLIYFFHTSLNETDLRENVNELVQHYHSHFARILQKFEYKQIPTLHQLQIEILTKYFHGE